MTPMRVGLSFDHVSISVGDVDAGERFYRDVLGFEPIPRPDFGFPGAWFRVGGMPVHLTTGGTMRGADASLRPNDPHFAIAVDGDLDAFLDMLRAQGVEVYELHDSPSALRQTFVKDPWGNVVELCVNFPPRSEEPS
jgi:glyoxylase I family protein